MRRTNHRGTRRLVASAMLAATLTLLTTARTEAQIIYPGTPSSGFGYPGAGGFGGIGIGGIGGFGYFPGYSGIGAFNPLAGSGYGGYGVGGIGSVGYGAGYGGYVGDGGYGVTPYSMAAAEEQQAAMNASRYNLNNAQAAAAYQAANLFNQQAVEASLEAYRNAKLAASSPGQTNATGNGNGNGSRGYVPSQRQFHGSRYNPRTGQANGNPDDTGLQPVPIGQMIARDGEVIWPLGAPEDGDLGGKKAAASKSIQAVAADSMQGREVPASRVIAARNDLAAYANPAAQKLQKEHPSDAPGFINYVRSLDQGLRSLAESGRMDTRRPVQAVGPIDIEPENTPKTAGDVLKEQIEADGTTGTRRTTRPEGGSTRPAARPARPEGGTTPPAGGTTQPSGNPTPPSSGTALPATSPAPSGGGTALPAGNPALPAGGTGSPALPAGGSTRPEGGSTQPR